MSTFTNTAREVEMPNGDVVVIHNAPTGGENTTSNIKKFKYDDNGHVTESTDADAEDLNLSGYSTPTTGSTDIGASDDVQTAIGKLDHQSHIDQTNILSVQDATKELADNGVKNLLPKLKSYTDSGLSMVINDDNSITAKWSATGGSTLYARINDNNWTLPRGTYVLSGMPNDSSIGCYIHIETNTSQRVVEQELKTPVEFTIANDYEYLKIYISVRPNSAAETSGVTILPMIVTKAISDIGADSYVPPALPNYDLTQEVNALHERTDQIQPVVKFETDASGWYRVFTLGSTNSVAAVGAYDNSCDIIIKRLFSNNNNEHHEIKLASIFESMKFIDECSKSNVLLINNIRYVSTSNSAYIDIYYSGSATNTIVCSVNNNAGEVSWKAVNTVSRVSETTTGETVWVSYAFRDNYLSPNDPVYIDTGSLNDLTENKLYYAGANVTDKPTSDWGFVRNTKFDSNTGMQEFVSLGTSSDAYIRTKVSGTWQAWKQITNS